MAKSKTQTNITAISKIGTKATPTAAALVVIHGAELGRKFDLRPKMTIGREATCSIQVDQDSVSRKHAQVETEEKSVYITDLKSTNGTYVNDEAVESRLQLRNGDLLKIGRTIFKFIAGGNIEAVYHDEIYRLTTMDGLTQIANRRFFDESLEREISRCRRYKRPLAIAMMDIDHFKNVNDQYGHLAGDQVLKHIALAVKPNLRREDAFARFGGEEFGILLPEVEIEEAARVAEKVRKIVEAQPCQWEDETIPVTVSLGVAALNDSVKEANDLVQIADQKLYAAKQKGRNQVAS